MFPIDQILNLQCSFMNVQKRKDQGWKREQSLKEELKGRLHTCLNDHRDCGNILLIIKFLDELGVGCVIISFFFPLVIEKGFTFNSCLIDFGKGR